MSTQPSRDLDTFENQYQGREYTIDFICPEFTSVCPMTGQPDFAEIRISYVPDARCIEMKSLKLYLWSYRDEGIFYEHITNKILDDVVAACAPIRATVVGDFNVRGGIRAQVTATYGRTEGGSRL